VRKAVGEEMVVGQAMRKAEGRAVGDARDRAVGQATQVVGHYAGYTVGHAVVGATQIVGQDEVKRGLRCGPGCGSSCG